MANLIQIKRSATTAIPSSLGDGELAYTSNGDILYIGAPDGSNTVTAISGKRYPGTLTANQALVANSTSGIDKVIVANLQPTGIYANGALGTSGQVLSSNGTGVYWNDVVTSITDLSDTNITSAANGALLFYDNVSSKWIDNELTGDATVLNTGVITLSTVNDDAGSYGDANSIAQITINEKGLITNASSVDIDHDILLNFVADEHIAHSGVTLTAGDGLSGGGDITSSRTFNVVANNGITSNADGVFVIAGTGVTVNATGVHIGQSVGTTDNVIFNDLTVSGNLDVNGTLTTIDTTNLSVSDSIIELSRDNGADTLDIGFYGTYNDGTEKYTGLFRDQNDSGVYKLFTGLQVEPTATVDTANNTFGLATLVSYLNSSALFSNSTVTNITANSTVSVSLTANTLSLSTALAGTSGGTGLASYTAEDIIVANSTNGFRKLSVGTDGQVLQSNGSALLYDSLDGGSF